MRHSMAEKRQMHDSYDKFIKNNPPRMPSDFSHKDYRRVVDYAHVAFVVGYNTAMNDFLRPRPLDCITESKP
jgi:hypothetical protein